MTVQLLHFTDKGLGGKVTWPESSSDLVPTRAGVRATALVTPDPGLFPAQQLAFPVSYKNQSLLTAQAEEWLLG